MTQAQGARLSGACTRGFTRRLLRNVPCAEPASNTNAAPSPARNCPAAARLALQTSTPSRSPWLMLLHARAFLCLQSSSLVQAAGRSSAWSCRAGARLQHRVQARDGGVLQHEVAARRAPKAMPGPARHAAPLHDLPALHHLQRIVHPARARRPPSRLSACARARTAFTARRRHALRAPQRCARPAAQTPRRCSACPH
jgi:hypothetical protein